MGIRPFDLIVVTVLWLIANLIFRNFERHVPIYRRLMKLVVILAVLSVAGFVGGKAFFWGAFVALSLGVLALHFWWFPKHGIHPLTAEPHDKYMELIQRMKGRNR